MKIQHKLWPKVSLFSLYRKISRNSTERQKKTDLPTLILIEQGYDLLSRINGIRV
jgi:hypothetical protein